VSGCARRFDQLTPKLTNNIQNLVEVFVHSLDGPPKRMVDNSVSLVVPDNMQEHGHLLLYRHPLPISDQTPLPKCFHQLKKGALFILIMDMHSVSVEW